MSVGNRIKYFRTRLHMKQKDLGLRLGFSESTAEARICQYESLGRTPRMPIIKKMAKVFGISPAALLGPDIDTRVVLMHTLFALEDMYGISIDLIDGDVILRVNAPKNESGYKIKEELMKWCMKRIGLDAGLLTLEEYDYWRHNYGYRK